MSGCEKARGRIKLFAPVYDLGFFLFAYFAGGERKLREGLLNMAEPLAGTELLELCAGTASVSILAAEAGAVVTAIDLSAAMLGVAKEKVKKSLRSVKLTLAEATQLPFADDSFDTVILSFGLHELCAADIKATLVQANRVLRPKGRLLILDFHKAQKRGFYQKLFFTFVEPDTVWGWINTDIQTLLRTTGFGAFNRTFAAQQTLQYISVEKQLL